MPHQTDRLKKRAFFAYQGTQGGGKTNHESVDLTAEQIVNTDVFIINAPVLATLREHFVGTSEQDFLKTRAGGFFQSFATQNNFPVIEVIKATDMYLQQ